MCSWHYIPSSSGSGGRGSHRNPMQFSSQHAFIQRQRSMAQRSQPAQRVYGGHTGQWSVASSADLDLMSESLRPGTPVLPGYIPPGTHAIPSYTTSGRPRPPPGFLPRIRSQFSDTPLFSDSEEEGFFPPETLPPIFDCCEEIFGEYGGGYPNAGGSGGFEGEQQDRSREKFGERLASFPEVPLDAHRRIFQMGNDIVDCFEVRLERFYRGSLLDSIAGCVAVFTKKERTGQRWLMVFKEDISRTVVKFNRLLTHSLLVSVVSQTAIEIEAAKSIYGPPAEMCVINFRNTEDSSRFFRTLQESQTTAWNHREVTQEQRMKNLFSRINVALAQNDLLINAAAATAVRSSRPITRPMTPPAPISRTPFTLRDRDPCGLLRTPNCTPRPSTSLAAISPSAETLADLDDDWRRRAYESGTDSDGPFTASVTRHPKKVAGRSASTSSVSLAAAIASIANTKAAASSSTSKLDGSGDHSGCETPVQEEEEVEPLPEDIQVEILDIPLYIKIDSDFEEVGKGTLQLVDHKDSALSELRLTNGTKGEGKKELVQQFIFKWNSAHKVKKDGGGENSCIWDGAASFEHTPDAVPERRHFMVKFKEEAVAEEFLNAFNKAVEKARNPAIRKRHISWYLQQKREYKVTADATPAP